MNRAELTRHIAEHFGAKEERLWADYPGYAVFRSAKNGKWFAVIMDVERSKLGLDGGGKTDIVNLKCDPVFIPALTDGERYLPAYHMNKRHWITAVLGSAPDAQIIDLLHQSFETVDGKKR